MKKAEAVTKKMLNTMQLLKSNIPDIILFDLCSRYYERLATVQARGGQASQQVLRDILKEVQSSMVPKTMLKEWATQSFVTSTDYWTFRKMFTLQLSLAGFAEYVLHLSRLNPGKRFSHIWYKGIKKVT